MTVTKDQAQMIATLVTAARPVGAPRWDAAGVMAALKDQHDKALAEVMLDAIACALDPKADTPFVIGKLDWRNRLLRITPDAPLPRIEPSLLCAGCGLAKPDCQRRRADQAASTKDPRYDDHEFVPVGAARGMGRPAEAAHEIASTLKELIRPLGDRPARESERKAS